MGGFTELAELAELVFRLNIRLVFTFWEVEGPVSYSLTTDIVTIVITS